MLLARRSARTSAGTIVSPPEGEPRFVTSDQHVLQAEPRAHHAEPSHVEQHLGFRRGWSEAFPQFIPQPINFAG